MPLNFERAGIDRALRGSTNFADEELGVAVEADELGAGVAVDGSAQACSCQATWPAEAGFSRGRR